MWLTGLAINEDEIMRRRFWPVILSMVFLTLAMAACAGQDSEPTATVANPTAPPADTPTTAPPTATPLTEPLFVLARIESLEVMSSDEDLFRSLARCDFK